MPSYTKTQAKMVSEAHKKASRFAKQMADHIGCKKVANKMGHDNSYVRPEKKYDGK